MGGSASTQIGTAGSIKAKQRSIDEERMVELLMPIYYTSVPLLQFEKDKAIKAWKLISGGLAPEFYRLKKNDPANVPCKTPMEFFGNQLVKRFISVHPVCQHMFSNTTLKQGTLFFRMISFVIATLEDEEKFDSHFAMLARTHNRMGVRAVECMQYPLSSICGSDAYQFFGLLLPFIFSCRWRLWRGALFRASFDSRRRLRRRYTHGLGKDFLAHAQDHYPYRCGL